MLRWKMKGKLSVIIFAMITLFWLSSNAYALEIYPSLIYRITTEKYKFSYSFFVKNDLPRNSRVTVEIMDLITDEGKFIFNAPDYPFTLKEYVTPSESEFVLEPNEQREVTLNFNVPSSFPGGVGSFAVKLRQEGVSQGTVEVRLNYIIPFFIRFKQIPLNYSITITEVKLQDLNAEKVEGYPDFGTLVRIKFKNNGNGVFIPTGTLDIHSKELKTSVYSHKIESLDLVVFPGKTSILEFYTPYILPEGTLGFTLQARSFDVETFAQFTFSNNNVASYAVYQFLPDIVLITEKTKNNTFPVKVVNLSPKRAKISVEFNNNLVSASPKSATIPPFKEYGFYIRTLEKDFDFIGDRLVFGKVFSEGGTEERVIRELMVILRGKAVNPSLDIKKLDKPNMSTLRFENNGDCVLTIEILIRGQKVNVEEIVLIPQQVFEVTMDSIIPSSDILIRFKPYGTDKFIEGGL